MELRWKEIEDRAGPVLGRAASEPGELSTADRQVPIELVALHIVRSGDIHEHWQTKLAANVDLHDAVEMLNDPGVVSALYRMRTGLVAIDIDTLNSERSRQLNDLEARLGMGGEAFATSSLEVLDDCSRPLAARGPDHGVAAGDALLIGDTPAVPFDTVQGRVGLRQGALLAERWTGDADGQKAYPVHRADGRRCRVA
jgi:hypothetical protein